MSIKFWLTTLILSLCISCTSEQKDANTEQSRGSDVPEVKQVTNNSIHTISPYKYLGVWVFDDARVGLSKEPFVEGIPEIIDSLVWDIPDAENGFTLYFSDRPMPSYELSLTWKRAELYGNWYEADGYEMEGWLCPSLFEYYEDAPEKLYIKAESK